MENTDNNNNSTNTNITNTTTTTASPKKPLPTLCTAGCGFFGNEAFSNMCSQCYKSKNKDTTPVPTNKPPTSPRKLPVQDDTTILSSIEKTRKHLRSPSPDNFRTSSVPTSLIVSPAAVTPDNNSDKPVQMNKGRCFKCRLKVPLAKQAANKCRCGYIFCDSHRYPDRHDCDIDYAKMDREILAKNNPKLHERPRGGRSFQRIDSL